MSSTESSGAPAEASATSPAPSAEPSFGSTRGSGLARGKAKRPSAPAAATAASSDYTPTAIAVVTAPREYQNPFAPVETSVAATESASAVAPLPDDRSGQIPGLQQQATGQPATVKTDAAPEAVAAPAPAQPEEPAELNILEPEQQKTTPAQTWESEGFRPARESRTERPRREESRRDEPRRESAPIAERAEQAPFDPSTIPAKFLYVRPGYNYVPTPSNYGGAPRPSRESRPAGTEVSTRSAPAAATPAKSGGFLGWLKSLFGGSETSTASAAAPAGEARSGERSYGRGRGDRGGRGSGGGGGDGQRRRNRGGRGRNRGDYRPEQGSSQGGV